MPYHILFDKYEEERLAGKSFGSTKSGIAPFYSDKYAKIGFQVNELFDEERLLGKLKDVCEKKNVHVRASISQTTAGSGRDSGNTEGISRNGKTICMQYFPVSVECTERRKNSSFGRTAGNTERSGSRNLPDGYLLFHTGQLIVQSVPDCRRMRSPRS